MFGNPLQFIRSYDLLQVIIEMAVIWVFVFVAFRFLRGTRGAGIIKGVIIVFVVLTLLVRVLGQGTDTFARLNFIYRQFLQLLAIALIVIFQPELRQAMIRLSQARHFRGVRSTRVREVIQSVCESVEFLSRNKFGALIAIERSVRLGGVIESGQLLDAKVSARLLESIFWPNSPLHDLGMVIREDRIVAAGVQFPLAEEGLLPARTGARHRAAAGLTMESDCVVVIVSEETGAISLAEGGKIEFDLPRHELHAALTRRLTSTPTAGRQASTLSNEPSAVVSAKQD